MPPRHMGHIQCKPVLPFARYRRSYVSRLVDDLNLGTRKHTHETSAYTRPAPCCGGYPCRVGWRAPTTTHSPIKIRRIPCRGTDGTDPVRSPLRASRDRSILSRVSPARRILPYTLPQPAHPPDRALSRSISVTVPPLPARLGPDPTWRGPAPRVGAALAPWARRVRRVVHASSRCRRETKCNTDAHSSEATRCKLCKFKAEKVRRGAPPQRGFEFYNNRVLTCATVRRKWYCGVSGAF